MYQPVSRALKNARLAVWILLAAGLIFWGARGHGWKMRVLNVVWTFHPNVTGTRPGNGQTGVMPDDFVAADVTLPNVASGVDADTLSSASVKLYRTSDHQPVDAQTNTSGAGDAIVLQPLKPLELNTTYTFEVTPGVKDTKGGTFRPYSMNFTTASNVHYDSLKAAFEKVELPTAAGRFASVTIGPDHKLYAPLFDGGIERFAINADGTLSAPELIDTVAQANHETRLIVGLRFDPTSTADHLVLWTTHSPSGFKGPADWTGKISRLSGANLEQYQDVVVGLPRAVKDHLTLKMDFGPDGAIYFSQGSNTAMGAPDSKWGFRAERLLTAAILRLDPSLIHSLPLNVKTEEDGNYDPFAPSAPLTIYASGIRVAYSVLWHSNGRLYAGVNGSAAHGNAPGTREGVEGLPRIDQARRGTYTGPAVLALMDVLQTQPDFITMIEKGAYYGHPNPMRAEFVENGGNPTAAVDPLECPQYRVGTMPDRNWHVPSFACGNNTSPNGLLEFHGKTFGGILDHKILIARFSGGKDIAILTLDHDGNIIECDTGIEGLTRLADPLDLVQDSATGFMYIDELGGRKLTLVRPLPGVTSQRVLRQTVTPPTAVMRLTLK